MKSVLTNGDQEYLRSYTFSYNSSKFNKRITRPKSAINITNKISLAGSKSRDSFPIAIRICRSLYYFGQKSKIAKKADCTKKRMNYKEFIPSQTSVPRKQNTDLKQTNPYYREHDLTFTNEWAACANAKKEVIPYPASGQYTFLPDINNKNSLMKKINLNQKRDLVNFLCTSDCNKSQSAVTGQRNSEPRCHQQLEDEVKKEISVPFVHTEIDQPTRFKLESDFETKKVADQAIKEGKIFMCNGPYQALRTSLRKRGWVEKFQPSKDNSISIPRSALLDDEGDKITSVRTADGVKLAFMSSIVQCCSPTLMFTVKTSEVVNRALNDSRIVNHFGRATAFTTKIGLSYSLRNSDLFGDEPCHIFFPRCYNLSCDEDKQAFIDDYNLTSCMAFLKYFVTQHENSFNNKYFYAHACDVSRKSSNAFSLKATDSEVKELMSLPLLMNSARNQKLLSNVSECSSNSITNETNQSNVQKHVSTKAIRFALDRCLEFIACAKNEDLGEDFEEMKIKWMSRKDKHWLDFQDAYRLYVTNKLKVDKRAKEYLPECKNVLLTMEKFWPQFSFDGIYNVWIMKPGAKSRGRGIKCSSNLHEITSNYCNSSCVTVAQKYIEKPLLIYKTKFDLRQWFLVTDWNPLTFWFYKEAYLRFCSKEFTLKDLHESIHLSNNSIQKNYEPSNNRPTELPHDNMWTSEEFKEYLRTIHKPHVWHSIIVPGMKRSILNVLLCTQDNVDHRKESFELFGADFMLTEDYRPWLIEINSSPSMARNTRATAYLVNKVLEDTVKVVIDRRTNPTCDTGLFELVHRQRKPGDNPISNYSCTLPPFLTGNKIIEVHRE